MSATATRRRLPDRRPAVTHDLDVDGRTFTASIGFFADGTPVEIFLCGGKIDSAMDAVLSDAAVLASLALQHGTPPGALAASMSRLPDGPWQHGTAPASPIAAAMDLVAQLAAQRAPEVLV